MDGLLPTTINLICLLNSEGMIRLKKNADRNSKYLDQVFEDFVELAKTDPTIRVFESKQPYEMIVLNTKKSLPQSFII